MANIYSLFRESYSNSLDKVFLLCPNSENTNTRTITFGEMDTLTASFAGALINNGVVGGERVIVQAEKTPEYVALYLATLQIGAIFVPLNTAYTSAELAYFIENAEPRLFVCDASNFDNRLQIKVIDRLKTEVLTLGDQSHKYSLESKAAQSKPFTQIKERLDDDLAAFLYTSGTTGRSKGAMLSHKNLSSNALTLHKYWQFQPEDILLHALPIFHVHGLFIALHCALLNASTVLFYPKYDVQQVKKGLESATVMMGVPTFYTRLLAEDDFGKGQCHNIRLFISGSAPMTEQIHAEWTERTGHQILERYGMTEAGMITSNPYDGERIPGTVGYALPEVCARITNDEGKKLGVGEVGNIEIAGPNVFQGYWKMPEKTAEEFRADGYFITGDLGTMDSEGRISIVGRGKDLIITGGYNVYPKEIEIIIDDIDQVKESAVIGIPHPDFGETVCSVVVTKPGKNTDKESILLILNEKLANFKRPKEVFFVEELPRNSMGKVQKNVLREQYADALKTNLKTGV